MLSRHSTERAIASPTPDGDALPRWRMRGSLTRRILAVNIIALALVGGSIFYLDGFRTRLIEERRTQQESELELVATVLASSPGSAHAAIIRALGQEAGDRIRTYDAKGQINLDSWRLGPRTFRLIDPATETWDARVARWMDAMVDRIVRAQIPPPYIDQGRSNAGNWPELKAVMSGDAHIASRVRLAPDRSTMISAATRVGNRPIYLHSVENALDVTKLVREERFRLFIIVTFALLLSVALSLFLGRTIVQPLRRLAAAAVLVRQGRARDVIVPRLPARNDEIGQLARALSDMTGTLRDRIDAVEAFAADVSHELKNPLASLSSAVESLDRVSDPDLRKQLLAIIGDDVRRLDRLITDIADISRLDAQLSRSAFGPVDLAALLQTLIDTRATRDPGLDKRFRFVRPHDPLIVQGDEARLARVFDNLIDNALSFAPPKTLIRLGLTRHADDATAWIEDDGPGIAPEARVAVFNRFHSDRPDTDPFGKHSGLGLAIAKTIVERHNGTIEVTDGESGSGGARFTVSLPVRGGTS
jgi:two-component system, OmpR family, sensor histidine kinase ChvG